MRYDLSAMLAGSRPHIDHVIGGQDRILIVLDNDHAVAQVTQMLQCPQQPVVVALMQPDRWLIEHVHNAGQAGSDL